MKRANKNRLLLLFALLVSTAVHGEPSVTTSMNYYDVFPTSTHDLRREIYRRSPVEQNGETFMGYTDWHVEWKFYWQRKKGLCNITRVNTFLDVTYTMPRISPGHEVSRALRQSFENIYTSLMAHEEGHMKSGLYAAREIEQALSDLGPFERCQELEKTANRTGSRIIEKYNRRDKALDQKIRK